MAAADWDAVRRIYVEGINSGDATFETAAPAWAEWDAKHLAIGRLTAAENGDVVGWAALSGVSNRCAYAGVAEVSVYVAGIARGRGVGSGLLRGLITASEIVGIWTLQAGIFPENAASVTIHQGCGFREIGRRERLGKLHGRWRDVLLLERRSTTVGTEAADSSTLPSQ
jgi:L-amino acid N-acyltransferase YncA